MKTRAMIWAVVLCLAQSAIGQVSTNFLFRNRFPIANDTLRCDLGPLYAWWAEELDAAQKLEPTGANSTNELGNATNRREKPMVRWFHINGEIVKENPQGWIVNGVAEHAPGEGYSMTILLIHPPRKELERFMVKSNLLIHPPPPPDYSEQEARIKTLNDRAFVASTFGDEYLMEAYNADAAQAEHELEDQKRRDQALEADRGHNLDDLGNFPADWRAYRVDVFALSTGRQLYGLPVYDAGLSFAK